MKKNILITGCSSGIGRSAALRLNDQGWLVVATVRTIKDQEELEKSGIKCVIMDYSDFNSISEAASYFLQVVENKPYAIFNNGAYGQYGAIEDLPTSAFKDQFDVNVFGWYELIQKILPVMINNGYGRIVNCSSVLGVVTLKWRSAYCASKHAIEALTECLRLEVAADGIFVSSIQPGPIATDFGKNSIIAIKKRIDYKNSRHLSFYEQLIDNKPSKLGEYFRLGPDAVVDKLLSCLESNNPKAVYNVTQATVLFKFFKWLLPSSCFEKLRSKV